MPLKPNFLILSGDGVNCENETKRAFEMAGAKAEIFHINEVLQQPDIMHRFQGLAFPGGFSFADDLGSGQIFSLKVRYGLSEELDQFLQSNKPIIGICNGFQVLVRLGLLPDKSQERKLALVENESGKFIDRWIGLKVNKKSHCIWSKDLEDFELPVRHGEGRLFVGSDLRFAKYLDDYIVFQYESDVNGSFANIAGLTDTTGLVLGMMPHPEAGMDPILLPEKNKTNSAKIATKLFENAVNFVKQN